MQLPTRSYGVVYVILGVAILQAGFVILSWFPVQQFLVSDA